MNLHHFNGNYAIYDLSRDRKTVCHSAQILFDPWFQRNQAKLSLPSITIEIALKNSWRYILIVDQSFIKAPPDETGIVC